MVRRLAGALAKAGAGELTIEQFTALLSGKPNPALPVAEWTAPSSGLFLESVRYRE
jgi:tRNA U38,U39,U40 pseudouridine synthase TruA